MKSDRLTFYLDLETTGPEREDVSDYLLANVKARGNLKDPEKIEADLAAKRETAWSDAALRPMFGRIACIGVAVNGDVPEIMTDADECALVARFLKFVRDVMDDQNKRMPLYVGYNVLFDLRYIWTRALVHGVPVTVPLHEMSQPWSANVMDLQHRLNCGDRYQKGTLKEWCLALGLESQVDDEDIDGADVPRAWENTNLRPLVMEHCMKDVVRCQLIHERLEAIGV